MSNSTQAEPLSLSSLSLDSRKATREHGRALLRRIREGLDLRSAPTLWNEYSLVSLQITRGPRLDIDQTEPALGEWRYFLPGPANEANRCKWPEFMAQFPPIRRQNRDGFHDDRLKGIALARNALSDASTVALHLHLLTQPTGWSPHGGMRAIDLASYWQSTQSYVSGRSQSHGFETDLVWSWPSPDSPCPHPDVPHMMALVTDSARPYSDEVLRSEVKAAIGLIMSQMRGSGRYPGHEVFPVRSPCAVLVLPA